VIKDKKKTLQIRISKEDKKLWERAAIALEYDSLSEYIRFIMNDYSERSLRVENEKTR